MNNIRSYIPLFMLIGSLIFDGVYTVKFGVNIKFYYLVLFAALPLVLIVNKKLIIAPHHILIPLILFLTAFYNASLLNTDYNRFIFITGAIFLNLFVFYNCFYNVNSKKDLEYTLDFYFNFMFFYSLLASSFYLFTKVLSDDPQIRLFGIFSEPSTFSIILVPAIFIFFRRKMYKTSLINILKVSLMIYCVLEAKSSVGYLGLMSLFFFYPERIKTKVSILFLLIILSAFAFSVSDAFSEKFINLVKHLTSGNLYTFADPTSVTFFTNGYVAIKSFLSNPIIGNGIGSHAISYWKYVYEIPGIIIDPNFMYIGLNFNDANSLFMRIVSETGLMGIFFLIFFIVKYYKCNVISDMTLVFLTMVLIREGNFVNPQFFFFIYMYYFNYHSFNYKNKKV
ncbi:hypothetical protein N8251_00235 [Alphaproteobacteria bacterium]|nr:hypothetical protein [Alphaproteobacteria bacterium]